MKFQNPSFKFFLNGQTNGRTDKPKAICSPLFQKDRQICPGGHCLASQAWDRIVYPIHKLMIDS